MTLSVFKILYWILNAMIIYLYVFDREKLFLLPSGVFTAAALVWVVLSIAYGYFLALYLVTRGKKGTCM